LEHLRDESHLQAVAKKESAKKDDAAQKIAIVEGMTWRHSFFIDDLFHVFLLDLVFPVYQSHLKKIKKNLKKYKQASQSERCINYVS
jgi:hypothetical protein